MGMLIYVILRGLCLVNEWNTIINLHNDMVKNIQNRTIKKKFHRFWLWKSRVVTIYVMSKTDPHLVVTDPHMTAHNHLLSQAQLHHWHLKNIFGRKKFIKLWFLYETVNRFIQIDQLATGWVRWLLMKLNVKLLCFKSPTCLIVTIINRDNYLVALINNEI